MRPQLLYPISRHTLFWKMLKALISRTLGRVKAAKAADPTLCTPFLHQGLTTTVRLIRGCTREVA